MAFKTGIMLDGSVDAINLRRLRRWWECRMNTEKSSKAIF